MEEIENPIIEANEECNLKSLQQESFAVIKPAFVIRKEEVSIILLVLII